jgi:hypothetical protein
MAPFTVWSSLVTPGISMRFEKESAQAGAAQKAASRKAREVRKMYFIVIAFLFILMAPVSGRRKKMTVYEK